MHSLHVFYLVIQQINWRDRHKYLTPLCDSLCSGNCVEQLKKNPTLINRKNMPQLVLFFKKEEDFPYRFVIIVF